MTEIDKLVVAIVSAVLKRPGPFSADHIAQAAHRLAQPPRGKAGLPLAIFCDAFRRSYENWNYDWSKNGEKWLLTKLASFAPSVVFDVGANKGHWLSYAHSTLLQAQFHCFKIVADTYSELESKWSGKDRVQLNGFGLSDQDGTLKMKVFKSSNELSTHFDYPHGDFVEHVCPVRAGGNYAREKSITHIDLLKIDVEGAEHLVLDGFHELLKSGDIDIIQFEYGKVNIISHFLLRDFYELLSPMGYSIGKLLPDRVDFRSYDLEEENFLGPNYVAVRIDRADIIASLRGS